MNPVPNADNRCSVSRPRQRSRAIRPPPRAVQLRPNVQWAEDAVDKQQPLTVAPIVEIQHYQLAFLPVVHVTTWDGVGRVPPPSEEGTLSGGRPGRRAFAIAGGEKAPA